MFIHNFFVASRYLLRTRLYSLVNIIGLAAAITATLLIGLWVRDELAFNKSFEHYNRIAQVYHHVTFGGEVLTIEAVPAALGGTMKTRVSGVDELVVTTWPREHVVTRNDNSFTESVLFAEPPFSSVFSLKMLHGSATLSDMNSVLLSRSLADKLFAGDAIAKVFRLADRDDVTVSGVFEDFPFNSTFAGVDVIAPLDYHFTRSPGTPKPDDWETYIYQCFVLLDSEASLNKVEEQMKTLLFDHASGDGKTLRPEGLLLPMRDWHLRGEFEQGQNVGGRIKLVGMLGLISIAIVVLACVNFVNLTTARSETRAKEIGVRKIMGSNHSDLTQRFLLESLILVLVAFVLAFLSATLALPWFNDLSGKQIAIPWNDGSILYWSGLFILSITISSGAYPALVLASMKVSTVLKKPTGAGSALRGKTFRRAMVVFQFAVSVILIIGTGVIFSQINHARNRPVGFDTKGIIHVAIRTDQLASADYNTIRNSLIATGVVENVAKSDFPITGAMAADASIRWEGMDPGSPPLFARNRCSHDFPATHGFQFLAGRDFSRDHSTDSTAVIVNEIAAKLIGEDVLGKKINFGYGKDREIIGVIRDQIRWSPYREQSPHLYYVGYDNTGYYSVRLKPEVGVADGLRQVEPVFRRHAPTAPFEYAFVDDDYNRLFEAEERVGKIALVFSIIAVVISCVGIFGLAAFSAAQRTKEIGIRKVLGASAYNVWKLLSGEFFWLAAIAILIGSTIAYFTASAWLEQFSYRVSLSWEAFMIATLVTLVVTLSSVSYQTLRAACMNPANSLKNE